MKMNEKKIFLTLETLNEGPLAKVELTPELEDKIIEEAMKFGEYRGIRISVECAIRDAFKVLKEIRGD